MANLYELTGDILHLQRMLEDGEVDIETFTDTLESINFDVEEKADGYAKVIKNITSDVNGLKDEEKRIADKRKTYENKIKTMKTNLENSMILLDKKKFKTKLFSFNVQKNAPSLYVDDDNKIPEQFYKIQDPILDKAELKQYIKDGNEIEGVSLKSSESLRIR